ncbi:thioredoxin fold domain-containing protein [Facklamia miroungae]|uniref:Bacteriocin transport accessory protein, putative n=1 Tax=Facklamia miroungae TaxID=120956 RepID=A0A1G7PB62_9LACT|nr:thioredoxin fold domain-containing protein [Facklamia miroungae]NKZ28627.1 conjugal transfer protein TraF [Facklamia miroungae]SDF82829.1 bacteriocin transport accessory protein, putative [Facklamia miroungae]
MNVNDFNEAVQHFNRIDSQEAKQLIEAREGNLVFVGRETCPYCRLFVGKLAEAAVTADLTVNFLHSQDSQDLKGTQAFRDQYELKTVPSLVFSDQNRIATVSDSAMTVEEIIAFARS